MRKSIFWKMTGALLLMLVAFVTGASGCVMFAEGAGDLPDGGKIIDGPSTLTDGKDAVDELYTQEIDKRITKIRPMATPIDQITRHAKAMGTKSMEVKYYTVGTRPIKGKLTAEFTAQANGNTAELVVNDPDMFSEADTIRVIGVLGYKEDGVTQDAKELVLCVSGAAASGNPLAYAVNGKKDGNGNNIWIPAIANGAVIVRMGKACAELDAQTSAFSNIPTPEVQYCQNFMTQVEQSTLDKLSSKEVDWNFSDLEEDSIFDMRMGMENTFLFGVKGKVKHPVKKQNVWFTGGIWWMAGKDIIVGEWNDATSAAEITDNELVDITKDLFTGVGVGNKRKILFAGSDMLAAFSKIKSDKFRLKESVENWSLKFKSFDTDFGEVLVIHHELFDQNGMSDCGLVLDPQFLTKRTFVSWSRNILDLKSAGIRNTDAIVLQEISCVYLRYAKAHARLKLAKSA